MKAWCLVLDKCSAKITYKKEGRPAHWNPGPCCPHFYYKGEDTVKQHQRAKWKSLLRTVVCAFWRRS